MASDYLREQHILTDFVVFIKGKGKIGSCPGFQPPNIKLQTEEFRGGGMDMTVEIPFGIEKMEFEFDLHTWDAEIFQSMGYGPGEMDCPIEFKGYTKTPNQGEGSIWILTKSLIKEIKPSKVQVGKKTELTVNCVAHQYTHLINGVEKEYVSAFDKVYRVNGVDKTKNARNILDFLA